MSKHSGKTTGDAAEDIVAGGAREGALSSTGRRFAICASRFNDFIVDKLVDGALDALRRSGADAGSVEIFRCPGAMELPGLARRVAASGRFQGVICLGAVIRGATPHFDLVVGEATRGIGRLAVESEAAIAFGVLACDTIEQAVERAGTKAGNRGFDAAMVAIEMADLYAQLARGDAAAEPAQDLPRRK
jgi:6,7-dimethyl-8-ribityllumazine synthase